MKPELSKPSYETPSIEVLGSVAQLTQWQVNLDKWHSAADIINGTAIAEGGPGYPAS
jgi:hypothetical protein